jgi:hypothetical protein
VIVARAKQRDNSIVLLCTNSRPHPAPALALYVRLADKRLNIRYKSLLSSNEQSICVRHHVWSRASSRHQFVSDFPFPAEVNQAKVGAQIIRTCGCICISGVEDRRRVHVARRATSAYGGDRNESSSPKPP